MRSTFRFLLAIAVATIALPSFGEHSDHPNLARGVAPGTLVDSTSIDSVNLLNGNLVLTVPLGPSYPMSNSWSYGFTLHYNSNIWDTNIISDVDCDGIGGIGGDEQCPESQLSADFNAGPGWRLSFGSLHKVSESTGVTHWVYVAPDGSEHFFYYTLHHGDAEDSDDVPDQGDGDLDTDLNVWYTRDGTYLRLVETEIELRIEFPGGLTRVAHNVDPNGLDWRVVRIEDRFENAVDIDYETYCPPLGGAPCTETWTITDSHGRFHEVFFQYESRRIIVPGGFIEGGLSLASLGKKYLQSLTLAAPEGQDACFSLQYERQTVKRSCKDDFLGTSLEAKDDFLTSIVIPDGDDSAGLCGVYPECSDCSHFDMDYYDITDPYFLPPNEWTCSQNFPYPWPREIGGAVKGMRLPTGGLISWDYETYLFPTGYEYCGLSGPMAWFYNATLGDTTGVDRKTTAWSDTESAVWSYDPEQFLQNPDVEDVTRTVHRPDGSWSEHYFNTRVEQCPDPPDDPDPPDYDFFRGWDYGLPFRYPVNPGFADPHGVFESSKLFSSTGLHLTTTLVAYAHDVLPPLDFSGAGVPASRDWYNVNRRVSGQKIVWKNPGWGDYYFKRAELTKFDGYGHYRKTRWLNDYPFGNNLKTQYTAYNASPNTGDYLVSHKTNQLVTAFTQWGDRDWLLDLFTFIRTYEQDDGISRWQRRDMCFDADGQLIRERIRRRSDSVAPTSDHDIVREHDWLAGNQIQERHYGADVQAIPTNTSACSINLSGHTPVYRMDHVYSDGVLSTSRFIDPATQTPVGFFSIDQTIDQDTGLVLSSRDISGNETLFDYDRVGRATGIFPEDMAETTIDYQAAQGTAGDAQDPLVEAVVAVANHHSVSGQLLSRGLVEYDGLGRPRNEKHLMADGGWNRRETRHDGLGSISRKSAWVDDGQYQGGNAPSTEFEYDTFGRVVSLIPPDSDDGHDVSFVWEGDWRVDRTVSHANTYAPSGVQEAEATTSTFFDAQGRLRKVREPSGAGGALVDTDYSYDVANRLVRAVTSAEGATQTRSWTYNNLGFLESTEFPEVVGSRDFSEYDPLGNLGKMEELGAGDSLTRFLTYHYDKAGRILEVRNTGNKLVKEFTYYGPFASTKNKWRLYQATRYDKGVPDLSYPIHVEQTYQYGAHGKIGAVETRLVDQQNKTCQVYIFTHSK